MEAVNPTRRYVRSYPIKKYAGGTKFINGDTLFARITPCLENGKIAQFVSTSSEPAFGSTEYWVFRAKAGVSDPGFVYYLAKSDLIRKPAEKSTVGASGRQRAQIEAVQDLDVGSVALEVQQKIAGTLGAYDDLIENNTRRIEKLEAMTRLVYRRFFEAPEAENWEELPIAEILSNHIGGGWGSDKRDDNFPEPAFVIRGTDVPPARSGDISGVPFRYHKISNLRSRALVQGDIIFEVSGGSKGQPLGRSMLVTKELLNRFDEPVMCASFCKRVSPNSELLVPEILYLSFLDAYENGEIETYSVQSTGISNFKWTEYINRVTRKIPPYELQKDFQAKVAPMFSQITILGKKNGILRHTRDLLLPRLMSGEVKA